ncbi:MAG TPA: NADH-quinone oxidoreductase subunit NuoF [Candidatus Merdicola faecigallinarum]|uniref:NADH-quinone oxidoreductase subunit NuoF n=1 Tax=Candidatus Merdicola faecigallinarum TaxID=2840862 RepID=A0A9D1M013_9FIRM|nr:NADH-quinone oxidoreductase subunit NuoF [Candidatus Merdicola faecigallinarum]
MKTINEIEEIRSKKRKELDLRVNTKSDTREKHILVCHGTGCTSSKSEKILENFKKIIEEKKIENVRVIKTGCFGLCAKGPIVIIRPEDTFYAMVTPDDCEEIIQTHIVEGNKVERLLCKDIDGSVVDRLDELTFYKKQKRIALKNCGVINPEEIDEYIAFDGYKALEKVLKKMTPEEVIEVMKNSGLRGRGGAGFPTGKKWELTRSYEADQKYVVCNADEGDPGAFMDRSILEGDPHSVLEAMEIAAYTIGATKGYIYVRAEYPIAVKRLQIAINQAREYGLLGNHILGTDFCFDIEIRLGAGAFVCGEETALLESIEGKRGQPRVKPPYPAESGLWGKPTLINNVETYANVAQIILNGAEWFSSIGTATSKGTKVFALGGNVNNIGLVEVPMGTTLREIVYDIGGGIPNKREFKAAQTGGPSGGCIPKEHLDTPIDYESLKTIGSMMGSGGLIVMDDTKCMVCLAKFYLEFTVSESCGKCTPCRIGTKRMLELLEKLCSGEGSELDIYKLEKLAVNIQKASICGLGQSAPNPVLSTLKYFREEFRQHAVEKECKTLECKAMAKITIDEEKCKGCGLCQKHCPVQAIEGEAREKRVINQDKCIKCGTCIQACPFKAIGN